MDQEGRRPLVLLADDDALFRDDIGSILGGRYTMRGVADPDAVVAEVAAERPDVVLLDLDFGPGKRDGLSVLEELSRLADPPPVIMLTGDRSTEQVVQAMRRGARDYVIKDGEPAELVLRLEACIEERQMQRRVRAFRRSEASRDSAFAAFDPETLRILDGIDRIADTDATVLITGETGTGKEVMAREIHRRSGRRDGPFIDVNSGGGTDELQEAALFGHERYAFTGAEVERDGLVAAARGGTLFLDEIGEASADLQRKLLRFVDTGTYRRVGSTANQRADARLIAATNRDLHAEVAAGRFREDLLYRLNVVPIHLPPLRDRRGDIVPLARLKLAELGAGRTFTPEAEAWLARQDWPGNVRDLRNVVERAAIRSRGSLVGLGEVIGGWPGQVPVPPLYAEAKDRAVSAFQHDYLVTQLVRHEGNITAAAEASDLARPSFSKMCKDLGIVPEDFKPDRG